MANIDNNTNVNQETFWLNGSPLTGVKNNNLLDTGTEKYWMNGAPVMVIYTKSNYDTGKFFGIFEE